VPWLSLYQVKIVNNTQQRTTPARLTEPAATKLPRFILIGVGLVYILAGLFFRDPWKSDDVIGIATMFSLLNESGTSVWLLPHIGATPYIHEGPLNSWIGALSITFFGPVFSPWLAPLDAAITAARLPNLVWFLMLTLCFWHGLFRLAQTPAAQPLALPFGGQPSPMAYGRMIADAGLLLLVATVGIIWRMHETSMVPLGLALAALLFYGLSVLPQRPKIAALTMGLALGGSFLNQSFTTFAPLFLATLAVFIILPYYRQRLWVLGLGIALCLLISAAWLIPAWKNDPYWLRAWLFWQQKQFTLPTTANLHATGRDLLWFLWPTWPLALIALWQWRSWLRAPHIAIAALLGAGGLLLIIFSRNAFEPEYMLLALPSAALAAFALPTLRRGAINALDWFAVMCYSLTAATVWLGWVAQQTGWPPKIAKSIQRQTEGYQLEIFWSALLIALLGTLFWMALVRWRLTQHPPALWRGTVLSAAGLITTWLLLVTLWMPTLNYARSYRTVSAELSLALQRYQGSEDCVYAQLNPGQRASFYVFNQLEFSPKRQCSLWLQQTSPKLSLEEQNANLPNNAELLWQGRRGGDRNEMFRLLRIRAR